MNYLFPYTSRSGTLAFPSSESNGMTLLDYFAGQCLMAITHNGRDILDNDEIAESAYGIAMAMMRERTKLEA